MALFTHQFGSNGIDWFVLALVWLAAIGLELSARGRRRHP